MLFYSLYTYKYKCIFHYIENEICFCTVKLEGTCAHLCSVILRFFYEPPNIVYNSKATVKSQMPQFAIYLNAFSYLQAYAYCLSMKRTWIVISYHFIPGITNTYSYCCSLLPFIGIGMICEMRIFNLNFNRSI